MTRKSSQSATPKSNSIQQTVAQHIRELRTRIMLSAFAFLLIGTIVYVFHDFFVHLIMAPLGQQKLIYLTPGGGFSFIFMVTFYVTLLIVAPFIMYQLYAFLRPAMPRVSRGLSAKVALAALALMMMGVAFGYLFAVPSGLAFLTTFAKDYVTPSLTADSYLSFVLGYVLGIGFLFQLPLLLLFWHWIHPLTPKKLMGSQRFVIAGAFIAAALLSPSPDALNQTIIAVPIIVVYQFGVLAVYISIRKQRAREVAQTRLRPLPRAAGGVLSGVTFDFLDPAMKTAPSMSSPARVSAPIAKKAVERSPAVQATTVAAMPAKPILRRPLRSIDGFSKNPATTHHAVAAKSQKLRHVRRPVTQPAKPMVKPATQAPVFDPVAKVIMAGPLVPPELQPVPQPVAMPMPPVEEVVAPRVRRGALIVPQRG